MLIGGQQQYDAKAADVWSMGICLFVMTMGAFPFNMVHKPLAYTLVVLHTLSCMTFYSTPV